MQIIPSTSEDKELVIDNLVNFNIRQLNISHAEYITPLNFHIKENDKIIAGINAVCLAKSSVFVSILWVDENHRGKYYGSLLLNHVEDAARQLGAKLIHLDTFDFQARGFYIKQGYQEFASLPGHPAANNTAFYMKKIL